MISLNVLDALIVLGVSIGAFRANRTRPTNQAFALFALLLFFWQVALGLVHFRGPHVVLWLRCIFAISAFFPSALWLVRETLRGCSLDRATFRRAAPWWIGSVVLAALCFTRYFIPPESTPENKLFGPIWGLHPRIMFLAYAFLFVETLVKLRKLRGIQRVEAQILLFGASAGLVIIGVSALWRLVGGRAVDQPETVDVIRTIVIGLLAITGWAVMTRKIVDVRQLSKAALGWATVFAFIGSLIALAFFVGLQWADKVVIVVICTGLLGATQVFDLTGRWRRYFLGSNRDVDETRKRLLAAARAEGDWEHVEGRCGETIRLWAACDRALIYTASEGGMAARGCERPLPASAFAELQNGGGGATPEMLQRKLLADEHSALADYLEAEHLGAIASGPTGPGLHPVVIATTVRLDGKPVGWNDVKAMQEWAGIVETALSRVMLSQQAREAEQLATAGLLGASLAHEIRNPLVTIKSLVQTAPTRFAEPEFKRLLVEVVPGEIGRIEQLAEGLMELGRPRQPRMETVRLNAIVENSVQLVMAKAREQMVRLEVVLEARPDVCVADPANLRQVVLNLALNAIDAVSVQFGERHVAVRTSTDGADLVLEVADNGPGVPDEVRQKLFRPFTTSRKTSGIGLGLAITADIVRAHGGRIGLVAGDGAGAKFRVTIPRMPPS